jgi:hypothetical protein
MRDMPSKDFMELLARLLHCPNRLRKNKQCVIPKGGVRPRNLLFLGFGEEKQIPRFARDDKNALFPQPANTLIGNTVACIVPK